MSTAMYDAREALIPGSAYDRSSTGIDACTLLASCGIIQGGRRHLNIVLFPSSWASVKHVLSNSRPDWNDWSGFWSPGGYEYSHTLQPGDAADASTQLPGADQRPCCR